MKLAMRFLGKPPHNMAEFSRLTEQMFGTKLHLKILSIDKAYERDFPIIKFCTLERTHEFMDNPHIKKWKENYDIDHMTLYEIVMGIAFGGIVTELHVQNYIVGKVSPNLDDENLKRMQDLFMDFNSQAYRRFLETELIKRGEGPQ